MWKAVIVYFFICTWIKGNSYTIYCAKKCQLLGKLDHLDLSGRTIVTVNLTKQTLDSTKTRFSHTKLKQYAYTFILN